MGSGMSEVFTDDDFGSEDMSEDSDWEDVDEDDDSVYSIPMPHVYSNYTAFTASSCAFGTNDQSMSTAAATHVPDDPLLYGTEADYRPWEHGGAGCHVHVCITSTHQRCRVLSTRAHDTPRTQPHTSQAGGGFAVRRARLAVCQRCDCTTCAVPQHRISAGVLEMVTCADVPPSSGRIVATWNPTATEEWDPAAPPRSLSLPLPAIFTRITNRPLTLATAHGGRVVFSGAWVLC